MGSRTLDNFVMTGHVCGQDGVQMTQTSAEVLFTETPVGATGAVWYSM